jgi:pimeloyl-ACP methyl ester carboxylesterase
MSVAGQKDYMNTSNLLRMTRHGFDLAERSTRRNRSARLTQVLGVGLVALAASAGINMFMARRAERRNPARGKFVTVNGVRIHYVERGRGDALVLLHGNGSMIEDFESSGLVDEAAKRFRVIAFDRPGFGHSERPTNTRWTPVAQADLLQAALTQMGITRAVVVGHSWGCSVAVAMGLTNPSAVSALVLASGYYYPSARADVFPMSVPALPVVGDLVRYTLAPMLSRLMWPLLLRKIFGPAPVPEKFKAFPKEMVFRPSQIRASAAETAMMIPNAAQTCSRYGDLEMPIVIVVGNQDKLIDADRQSARLHDDVSQSRFHRVPGSGHMVHQTATSDIMAAIIEAQSLVHADKAPRSQDIAQSR